MTRHSIAKEVHRLMKSIKSFSDGQAKVIEWDPDCIETVTVELAPYDGPYKGGRFKFQLSIDIDNYPECPPGVTCLTTIYHPNIDPTADCDDVCLSLFDEWQSSFGLEDCIQGLLFLLYNPNLDDPLSPLFEPGMSEEDFLDYLKKSLKGESIDDVDFDPNEHVTDKEEDDAIEDGVIVILEKVVNDLNENQANNESDNESENETRNETTTIMKSQVSRENDNIMDNSEEIESQSDASSELKVATDNCVDNGDIVTDSTNGGAESNLTSYHHYEHITVLDETNGPTDSYVHQASKISRQSSKIDNTDCMNELDDLCLMFHEQKTVRNTQSSMYIFMDADPYMNVMCAGVKAVYQYACHYFKSHHYSDS